MQKHCRGLFTRYGYRLLPAVYPREIGPCEKLENAARARISLSLSLLLNARPRHNSFPNRCGALARAARHSYPTCLPFSLSLSLLVAPRRDERPLACTVRDPFLSLSLFPSFLHCFFLFRLSAVCRGFLTRQCTTLVVRRWTNIKDFS